MIISPCLASMTFPSTVILIGSPAKRTRTFFDVDEELVAEHLDGRGDRGGDGGAEHADGGLLGRPAEAGGDVVTHVEQQLEVGLPALAQLDAAHDLVEPAATLPAGRALTAGLPVEEPGDAPGGPDHARGVVHDDDRARSEHGPGLADRVLVEGHVDLVGAEPRGRHAPGHETLQLPVVADAATELRVVD